MPGFFQADKTSSSLCNFSFPASYASGSMTPTKQRFLEFLLKEELVLHPLSEHYRSKHHSFLPQTANRNTGEIFTTEIMPDSPRKLPIT
jgi:hypothetical protein